MVTISGRVLLLAVLLLVGSPSRAGAVLVYQHTASGRIMVARNDGSHPRAMMTGRTPKLSPSGRRVAYTISGRGLPDDLRLAVIGRGGSRLLLRGVFTASLYAPWSPNSRYLAVPIQGVRVRRA